jgi:hypothetical protein
MKWWLTVFFLVGNSWISGDQIDGWGSRAFDSRVQCEQRRTYAEGETRKYPLDLASQWVCNEGAPALKPPPPTLEANRGSTFVQTPGGVRGASAADQADVRPLHPGLRLFTNETDPWIAEDAIGLRFSGPLTSPLADDLRRLLLDKQQVYNHVILELDSPGGELGHVRQVVEVLREVRKRAVLVTRVMGAQVCASGCVAVFMQGARRKASGASVWVFHGACSAGSNIPSKPDTEEFLSLLETSGVNANFLCELRDHRYVSMPGNYFLSGYELFSRLEVGYHSGTLALLAARGPGSPAGLGATVIAFKVAKRTAALERGTSEGKRMF